MQKIICFHNPDEENGYLSNWYMSEFLSDGMLFTSMEQCMMYEKAKLFGDYASRIRIVSTNDVAKIKQIGREVKNFDSRTWDKNKEDIICKGLYAKFSQNEDLKAKLLATGDNLLAECAVKDRIWGIGLSMTNPDRLDPKKWNGQNLLGKCLMKVRDQLRSEGKKHD